VPGLPSVANSGGNSFATTSFSSTDEPDGLASGEAPQNEGGCTFAPRERTGGSNGWLIALAAAALAGGRRRKARAHRSSGLMARLSLLMAVFALVMVAGCGGGNSAAEGNADEDSSLGEGGIPPRAKALLDALGTSVWHGLQGRDGKTRAYELKFDAPSLLWSEIRNPYGPARLRELRVFKVDADGLNVHSTVITPAGWPVPPDDGRDEDWTIEVLPGSPRKLRTAREGVVEEFEEGELSPPVDGLTATVRLFPPGGDVDDAFCASGLKGFDYGTILNFAREGEVADVVAGAKLLRWSDPTNNRFSIADVPGFDRLGGTELRDRFNFFVTYEGTVQHPGGAIRMRERDDSVEDAVWTFLGPDVGSSSTNDVFLEVHGFVWPELSSNEPSTTMQAGNVPIEAILVRCAQQIQPVDVEIALGNRGYQLVGNTRTKPLINEDLFPPAL
jgi:hypothetical protein